MERFKETAHAELTLCRSPLQPSSLSQATAPAFLSVGMKASVPIHRTLARLLAELLFVPACLMQKPKSTVSIVLAAKCMHYESFLCQSFHMCPFLKRG